MPTYAIGDVHGCLKSLNALLDQLQPSASDQLVFIGDLIDRGPDSKGVIERVRQLEADPQAPEVVALMGNHEVLLLEALHANTAQAEPAGDGPGAAAPKPADAPKAGATADADREGRKQPPTPLEFWIKNGGDKTLASFGLSPEGVDLKAFPEDVRDWLVKRPLFLKTDTHILVHAGLNLEHPDPFRDPMGLLWIRNWVDERILRERFPNTLVVHGHTPVERWVIEARNEAGRPSLDIDAGCVYNGSAFGEGFLCALDLSSRKLYFQENVE